MFSYRRTISATDLDAFTGYKGVSLKSASETERVVMTKVQRYFESE